MKAQHQQWFQDHYEREGELVPSVVLAEASLPECPIHELFEWNDSKAAHQHRLNQSRKLCREVRIVYREHPRKLYHCELQMKERGGREGSYQLGEDLVTDEVRFQAAFDALVVRCDRAYTAAVELETIARSKNVTNGLFLVLVTFLSRAKRTCDKLRKQQ